MAKFVPNSGNIIANFSSYNFKDCLSFSIFESISPYSKLCTIKLKFSLIRVFLSSGFCAKHFSDNKNSYSGKIVGKAKIFLAEYFKDN